MRAACCELLEHPNYALLLSEPALHFLVSYQVLPLNSDQILRLLLKVT